MTRPITNDALIESLYCLLANWAGKRQLFDDTLALRHAWAGPSSESSVFPFATALQVLNPTSLELAIQDSAVRAR